MLLYFVLNFFQPIATPIGDWPGTASHLARTSSAWAGPQPPGEEARLAALRRTLFKMPKPALLSHDLPRVTLEPPRPVAIPRASDSALRELGAQPAGFTSYDRHLGSVRTVMAGLTPQPASLAQACRDLRVAHGFRYTARDPYSADPPATTAARRAGDCKSKALWLYERLADPTALYVIGKVTRGAKTSHAWLYWRWEDRWWILDPTNLRSPIAADSVGPNRYVPYYSFARDGAYRHAATSLLVVQNDAPSAPPLAAKAPRSRKRL
jgi:hypothetical protein